MQRSPLPLALAIAVASTALGAPPVPEISRLVDAEYTSLESLYRELHAAPELSLHEEKSSARMAG